MNYASFDPSSFLDSHGTAAAASSSDFIQQQQQPPPHSPPDSLTQQSEGNKVNGNVFGESGLGMGRSSSEEKDGVNADPNKRKAQNRAAYVSRP